jgi:SAM-dependent methyltransferase
MKLHLGCGRQPMEGWVNVDVIPGEGVDRVCDITRLPFEDSSASEIYARHVIEHIIPIKWESTLAAWFRILRPGGKIVLECPDLKKVCEYFAADYLGQRNWWHRVIYGDPRDGGSHLHGFTLDWLVRDLKAAGFVIEVARTWHDYSEPKIYYNLRVEAVKS